MAGTQILDRPIDRPQPLAEQVADTLRVAIIEGALASGDHLSVPDLARRLGVSRTPAREALLILEREGLVGRRDSAGMQVLAGGTETLVELLEMREVLEGLAARRAAERMDENGRDALQRLHARHREVLAQDDLDEHVVLDTAFHALVREGAQSGALTEQLGRIDRIVQVVNRALSGEQGFDPAVVDLDHGAIIAAIIDRDPDGAEQAARNHVRRMRRFLVSQSGEAKPAGGR